ncbi:hypothetical protein LSTR_LSTR011858 [Laodelphax striatellus]|uniref:Transposase domain-containing protein n=1 Tax=Laodelphax striatellus TaxID=195883 RepID=A0A482XLL5_LAOST|nr:hypothetical protein LSTR_LSTR011858 [Laodelphax striatellus]
MSSSNADVRGMSPIMLSPEYYESSHQEETPSSPEAESSKESLNFAKEHEDKFSLDSFKNDLSYWCVNENINHKSVNSLLKILKSVPDLNSLPDDARTLLKTPRCTAVRPLGSGEYIYLGIENGLKNTLKSVQVSGEITELKLLINIDGLPVSKSSGGQMWPQLGKIRSIKSSPVFVIGLYYGNEKPSDSNEFMSSLVDELNFLFENGFYLNGLSFKLSHVGFVCDMPAKAFVLKIKGHTGFFSCTRCTVEGKSINNRMCFTDLNCSSRTHESFCSMSQEEHHIGATVLTSLNHIDLISSFSLDYMHLVCLGVMKKLILLWLKGELQYRFPHRQVQNLSDRLVSLKKFIPSEFARKPRPLFEVSRWKATEFRQFLLYTGVVVLPPFLSSEMMTNFMSLHVSLTILLKDNKGQQHITDYAKALLKFFVEGFGKIYGKQFVSQNVHGLIHLADDVSTFGPLDECSAFPFESYMQMIKKSLRKSEKPVQQFVRRLKEKESICQSEPRSPLKDMPTLKKKHEDGPLTLYCQNPQYKEIVLDNFKLSTVEQDSCCGLKDKTIVKVKNFCYNSKMCCMVVVGRTFSIVGDLYEKPTLSSNLGTYVVKLNTTLKSWPVSEIERKYVQFPHGKDSFIVIPLIHSDIH